MSEEESQTEDLEWPVQKKLNIWDEKRKYKSTLEELIDGHARYAKFIKIKMGDDAMMEAFRETIECTYDKNMGALNRLGVAFLSKVSKKILHRKIVNSFFINMQHVVELSCIRKLEYYPDYTEIIIDKCTGKRAWKMALKKNNANDLFSEEDYCKYSCIPLFNRFLTLSKAQTNAEFSKRGCHQIVKFIKKE